MNIYKIYIIRAFVLIYIVGPKFHTISPAEGERLHRPKRFEFDNGDENTSLNNVNNVKKIFYDMDYFGNCCRPGISFIIFA